MEPSGTPFGAPFGPQAIRNRSPRRPWAGQEPIKISFFRPRTAPRAPQEASKSAPYAPGSPPWPYQAFVRAPRGFQETSRAHLAAMWVPFGSNFTSMSMRCCHHVGYVSSLKAPSPRALDPRSQAWRNARERSAAHLWWCWACFQDVSSDSGLSKLK